MRWRTRWRGRLTRGGRLRGIDSKNRHKKIDTEVDLEEKLDSEKTTDVTYSGESGARVVCAGTRYDITKN